MSLGRARTKPDGFGPTDPQDSDSDPREAVPYSPVFDESARSVSR